MVVLKNMLALWIMVIFLGHSSRCGDAVHDHHVNGFGEILKTMMLNNSMELQNLTTLLKDLGLDADCTNKTAGRPHKCVTAVSLFEFNNISTTSHLQETNFANIATFIVYSLLPWTENHSDGNLNDKNSDKDNINGVLTRKVAVYEEILERYETSSLCEQVLDQLLRDVNESIGKHLNNPKCFSSHEILHQMNISNEAEITKETLPELSTIIISKLLQKRCINVQHKTPLPCPSYFVNDLFSKFSHNNVIDKKKMEELLRHLKIIKHGSTDETMEDDSDDHNDDGHNHRRHRRSKITSSQMLPNAFELSQRPERKLGNGRNRRESKQYKDNHVQNIYKKCYSADELFSIYHVDEKTGFNVETFEHLNSALLQEIESNVCVEVQKQDKKSPPGWGYGLAAAAIISLCCVIMIIPTMQVKYFRQMLVFFISLAIGTLVGDALLHLLPHATGFHDDNGQSGLMYMDKDKSYLWKFLAVVAGVYGLFLFETTVQLFFCDTYAARGLHSVWHTHGNKQLTDHGETIPPKTDVETAKSSPKPTKQSVVLVNMVIKEDDGAQVEDRVMEMESSNSNVKEKTKHKNNIAPMAWTIIIGDTIHNIADGIAIGVAFSESIFGGISTSIAVVCHEVPHELGDFVVLLESGMSVWQALLANFLSSCFCFLGVILGKLISDIEDVNLWILAITAGFFLYIALTSKLPELMRISAASDLSKLSIAVVQNTGILVGLLGMTLLAFYEKDINI